VHRNFQASKWTET